VSQRAIFRLGWDTFGTIYGSYVRPPSNEKESIREVLRHMPKTPEEFIELFIPL
jgi:hypothetical protein